MSHQIEILDEGKHHIVVNKPTNMLVVAGRGAPKPTLLDLMQKRFGKGIRPVHRLDRVTTGCCIFAKTLYGQQALADAFRRHLINKKYLAIIEGNPSFEKLNIYVKLKRIDTPNARKGPLAHQIIADDGKRALTRIKVLQRGEHTCLVEARPETGRMHQIRAHLAHVGHPIVGDKQYGSQMPYKNHAIALFAAAINFPPPEAGRKRIEVQLPISALPDAPLNHRKIER